MIGLPRRFISVLSVITGICVCGTLGLTAQSGSESSTEVPRLISTRSQASPMEQLAAYEVARYGYLRTGRLLPVKHGSKSSDRIAVSRKDARFCGTRGQDLAPQQFLIRTERSGKERVWWIIGGDEVGTLYGAYRFAEHLGVQFNLDEDALPHQPLLGPWPDVNETGRPRFSLRGLQPFHDFSVGPDWWNLQDYESVLSQMAKLRLNFIGLHTYPSWNPAAGPEANVWIGLPEDVDHQGNVKFGYEAGVVTTRRGWAVTPFPTSQYASGAGKLFESDDFAPEFMGTCLQWPTNQAEATALFNRYGEFQKKAFSHAKLLGINTCVGTELPLGVPKALAARLKSKGMDPSDPEVIRRLYEGTLLRVSRKMPVDYYWFWVPEVWLSMEPGCANWEMTSRERIEKDLRIAATAADSLHLPFSFATCGWRLGTREDPLWMHKRAPLTWAASSINTGLGRDPVESAYGQMPGRAKWAIGWAEDDDTAGAHCCTAWDLQLWAERLLANSAQAANYKTEGMMAIHWRTAAIAPNIAALAQAGWEYETGQPEALSGASCRSKIPTADEFWTDWGRGMFGTETGPEIGRTLKKLDGSHLRINDLIRGGAKTTDQQIAEVFRPLRGLETLRAKVAGAANLERLDYWIDLIAASEARVQAWVLAARLGVMVSEAKGLAGPQEKRSFAEKTVLPLRIELARKYERIIAALVRCAKSPGELGTISSIESGSRNRIVLARDSALTELLGRPLPAEAVVNTAYSGPARVFVSSRPSHTRAGQPVDTKCFVLSEAACKEVSLYWRPVGETRFNKAAGKHLDREAYCATFTPNRPGIFEYYVHARLAGGEEVKWPSTRTQTIVAWER